MHVLTKCSCVTSVYQNTRYLLSSEHITTNYHLKKTPMSAFASISYYFSFEQYFHQHQNCPTHDITNEPSKLAIHLTSSRDTRFTMRSSSPGRPQHPLHSPVTVAYFDRSTTITQSLMKISRTMLD